MKACAWNEAVSRSNAPLSAWALVVMPPEASVANPPWRLLPPADPFVPTSDVSS
jgi:hypothetical protein